MNSALGSGSIPFDACGRLSAYLSRALQIIIFNWESIKYWPLDREDGERGQVFGSNANNMHSSILRQSGQTLKNCSHGDVQFCKLPRALLSAL